MLMVIVDDEDAGSSSTPVPKTQATTASAVIPPPGFVPMPMMPGIPPVHMAMGHMMPMGELCHCFSHQLFK